MHISEANTEIKNIAYKNYDDDELVGNSNETLS